MVANQTEVCLPIFCAENIKACEIYKRMCDVSGEVYVGKKNGFKFAKYGFAST